MVLVDICFKLSCHNVILQFSCILSFSKHQIAEAEALLASRHSKKIEEDHKRSSESEFAIFLCVGMHWCVNHQCAVLSAQIKRLLCILVSSLYAIIPMFGLFLCLPRGRYDICGGGG